MIRKERNASTVLVVIIKIAILSLFIVLVQMLIPKIANMELVPKSLRSG